MENKINNVTTAKNTTEKVIRVGAIVMWQKIKGRGRGVIAQVDIEEGQVIEVCPVLLVKTNKTIAKHVYLWDNKFEALALGYGSLYNHSYKPNAHYHRDYLRETIVIVALKNIEIGEEILINYNGVKNSKDKVDFEVV